MSKVIRRLEPRAVRFAGQALADNECEITLATSNLALDHDIWDVDGMDLSHFASHPIILFDHNPGQPVGRASDIRKTSTAVKARVQFAAAGASPKADEVRALVKSGILSGVSAAILPLESEPLDPRNPRGGRRITKSTLLEASFVAVPSDRASAVTARRAPAGAFAARHPFLAFAEPYREATRRRWRDAAAAGRPTTFGERFGEMCETLARARRDFERSHGGAAHMTAGTPLEGAAERLVTYALRSRGEVLTVVAATILCHQAAHLGRSPTYHYDWLRAAGAVVDRQGGSDFLRRQAEAERLRRCP